MDPQSLQWLIGILIIVLLAVIGAMFGLFLKHMGECRDFREKVAGMSAKIDSVKAELGDHETGVRGALHQLRDDISPWIIRAQMERDRQERQR